MLNLVLADAELELIPQEIIGHPSVRKSAEKRGKKPFGLLLDSSVHSQALRELPQGTRRGRPDIVHLFLLLAQDSIANREGKLRVWIHTAGDVVISVSPKTRIPSASPRFNGLMESLFLNGVVPDKKNPLLEMREQSLSELLIQLGGKSVCLHPDAPTGDLTSAVDDKEKDVTIIIGGFAEGDFSSPVKDLVDESISIHTDLLKVWTITAEVLGAYTPLTRTSPT